MNQCMMWAEPEKLQIYIVYLLCIHTLGAAWNIEIWEMHEAIGPIDRTD